MEEKTHICPFCKHHQFRDVNYPIALNPLGISPGRVKRHETCKKGHYKEIVREDILPVSCPSKVVDRCNDFKQTEKIVIIDKVEFKVIQINVNPSML